MTNRTYRHNQTVRAYDQDPYHRSRLAHGGKVAAGVFLAAVGLGIGATKLEAWADQPSTPTEALNATLVISGTPEEPVNIRTNPSIAEDVGDGSNDIAGEVNQTDQPLVVDNPLMVQQGSNMWLQFRINGSDSYDPSKSYYVYYAGPEGNTRSHITEYNHRSYDTHPDIPVTPVDGNYVGAVGNDHNIAVGQAQFLSASQATELARSSSK